MTDGFPRNPQPSAGPATHAVILAAGIGRRLQASPEQPKALLEFGGTSLLARHVTLLRGAGICDITVVVGHGAAQLCRALDDLGVPVSTIGNPAFRDGSVVSLHAAASVLRSAAPLLLMDADVLYDARLLARLTTCAEADCFLLDRTIEPGDEPVKLCIDAQGRIVDFRKQPTVAHAWHGESVGFFRFSPAIAAELAQRAGAYVQAGRHDAEYEEPIRDMILAYPPGRFGWEDISGLPWTEIDFPADIVRARSLLPDLHPLPEPSP